MLYVSEEKHKIFEAALFLFVVTQRWTRRGLMAMLKGFHGSFRLWMENAKIRGKQTVEALLSKTYKARSTQDRRLGWKLEHLAIPEASENAKESAYVPCGDSCL